MQYTFMLMRMTFKEMYCNNMLYKLYIHICNEAQNKNQNVPALSN